MKTRLTILLLLVAATLLIDCGGTKIPKTVAKQGKARLEFEEIRQIYFDTGDLAATRQDLAALMEQRAGQVSDRVFQLLTRLDRFQDLELKSSTWNTGDQSSCRGDLAALRMDRKRLSLLMTTSHGAEKMALSRIRSRMDDAELALQNCVVRQADTLDEQMRILATSQDPAIIRPLIDKQDHYFTRLGKLDEILDYLQLSRGYRHSPELIHITDNLLLESDDLDLIVAYLFYYQDHPHRDALWRHLDKLYLATGNWVAAEAYLQRCGNRPHSVGLEAALQKHYQQEYSLGGRLWDRELFAEAVGHLAAIAPRSPLFGAARSLMKTAAEMDYYRWEQPEVWLMVPPYRW